MNTESPIIVIGAGIGGLALALALQRRKVPVVVYERAPELGEVGAGLMLTPNSNRVLDYLGVLAEVERGATKPGITQTRHYQTGVALSTTDIGEKFTGQYGKPYYDVHRIHIHSALHKAVAANDPGCIRVSHDFSDVADNGATVTATFANMVKATGRLLVGCDGVRSVVRTRIGITDGARYTGNLAWRGMVPVGALPPHLRGPEVSIWTGPGHHFVEYTVKSGTMKNYVAIANHQAWAEESWSVRASVEEPMAEFKDWHADVQTIIAATPPESCIRWGLFDRDPLDRWSRGRVTLLGDACHPMLPFMAQGAAMALEDAVVLVRCLEAETGVEKAFARYEKARIERAAWCQIQSRENGKMYQQISSRAVLDHERAERGRRLYMYDAATVAI